MFRVVEGSSKTSKAGSSFFLLTYNVLKVMKQIQKIVQFASTQMDGMQTLFQAEPRSSTLVLFSDVIRFVKEKCSNLLLASTK